MAVKDCYFVSLVLRLYKPYNNGSECINCKHIRMATFIIDYDSGRDIDVFFWYYF